MYKSKYLEVDVDVDVYIYILDIYRYTYISIYIYIYIYMYILIYRVQPPDSGLVLRRRATWRFRDLFVAYRIHIVYRQGPLGTVDPSF